MQKLTSFILDIVTPRDRITAPLQTLTSSMLIRTASVSRWLISNIRSNQRFNLQTNNRSSTARSMVRTRTLRSHRFSLWSRRSPCRLQRQPKTQTPSFPAPAWSINRSSPTSRSTRGRTRKIWRLTINPCKETTWASAWTVAGMQLTSISARRATTASLPRTGLSQLVPRPSSASKAKNRWLSADSWKAWNKSWLTSSLRLSTTDAKSRSSKQRKTLRAPSSKWTLWRTKTPL